MPVNPQRSTDLIGQSLGPHRLASLGPAQAQDMPAMRMIPEIMIKADHAMHLGTGHAQGLGDDRLRGLGDMAPFGLNVVQNGQTRPLAALMGGDDLIKAQQEISVNRRYSHGW